MYTTMSSLHNTYHNSSVQYSVSVDQGVDTQLTTICKTAEYFFLNRSLSFCKYEKISSAELGKSTMVPTTCILFFVWCTASLFQQRTFRCESMIHSRSSKSNLWAMTARLCQIRLHIYHRHIICLWHILTCACICGSARAAKFLYPLVKAMRLRNLNWGSYVDM